MQEGPYVVLYFFHEKAFLQYFFKISSKIAQEVLSLFILQMLAFSEILI